MSQNYTYERITKNTLIDFYKLFKTRRKDFSFDFFEKKYNTKWLGKEYLGVLAFDIKRNAVGHICILPMKLQYNGKEYLCGQICDIVVHPEHKRKGIFEELIAKGKVIAKEEGIAFLFVSPNQNAQPIFNKWNWYSNHCFNVYTFNTKCFPLNKIANKYKLLKLHDLYIKIVLKLFADNKKTAFKNSVIENGIGGIIRGQEYVSHKNYTYNYITKIGGFKIWWKIDDGISIGDIERFDSINLERLFKRLRFLCLILGFHNFKIVANNNTFIDQLLKDKFPFEKGNNVYFWDISSGIDFLNIKFMQSDLNTF